MPNKKDETSVTGVVVDPADEIEALVTMIANDPLVAVNSLADMLDAFRALLEGRPPAEVARILSALVDELGRETSSVVDGIADAISRKTYAQTRIPFLTWLNQILCESTTTSRLAEFLIKASEIDADDWTSPQTRSEYAAYLSDALCAGLIEKGESDEFGALWQAYSDQLQTLSGDWTETARQTQYCVYLSWPDGTVEQHADTRSGVSRQDAERICSRYDGFGGRATGTVLRRTVVQGAWTKLV